MARPRDRRASFLDVLWLLFFGALSAGWCVTAAQALSATFDEPTYLRLGLEHWRSGSSRALMKLGTMPLAVDLQTLPLFVWERWRGLPVDPARDIAWILPWARAVTLAFWWTLLFYAWRSGRALSGPWAGRLAVALIASEPIFLAHASLATSDIAVTACLLAFFFEFRAQRDRSWPLRVALPALLYGIAVLMKASALAFGVVGMFAIEVERRLGSGSFRDWRQDLAAVRPFLRDVIGVVAGGLVVTFVYCGSDWRAEPAFIGWAKSLAPGTLQDGMVWIAEHVRIFSNAGEGLAEQIRHNTHGHGAYLLGREYRRAIWFYFPVALTIKTSLPLLLLPLVVASIQRSALWNWACLVAFALLLFSLSSRVQIGVRLMLPLLACLAVGVAAAIIHVMRSSGERWRAGLIALVGVCLVGNGVAAARVWPEALCYTNAVWGGTRTGYRLLSDSNYDWGQGLLELEQWGKQHGVETIDVWYFGLDPRAQVPPFRLLPMHTREWSGDRSPALAADDKIVAVGTTLLFGAYVKRAEPGRGAVAFFLAQEPIDRTSTFFIYDLRREKP